MEAIAQLDDSRSAVHWAGARVRLAVFSALLTAVVVAFAAIVIHFQNDSRRQAEQRFGDQVTLTSEFTGALLGTSASASSAAAAKQFGEDHIDPLLNAAPGALYTVILDAHGKRLAETAAAPAAAASPSATHIRQALAGHAWFSDLIVGATRSADTIEWAIPFTTPSGRRVEVEAVQANAFVSFLNALLTKTERSGDGVAFILDEHHRVIGSSSATIKTGQLPKSSALVAALDRRTHGGFRYTGTNLYFASSPIAGSTWVAVTSIRASSLYPALAGSQAWLLYAFLVAFALTCLASVLFFRRALVSGAGLRRSNDELAAINSTLEDRVAERTAAAEDRARELARSNEELEQFSSVASHDLQEPLRKIRMFGDRLRDRLGDTVSAEAADDLDRMRNAAERMQRLISDLLAFSRVRHRGDDFETVDLRVIASEVVSDLEARIVELDATVDVGELPVVYADRTQMRQLLQNLIGNALKFHRPGVAPTVRVGAEIIPAHAPRFAGEAMASDRYVLTVEDNGIGFDDRYAERIFGAFERLHGRSAYDGTGIGLSIARKIVWRHGGLITASGVPDQGATFVVTLPLRPPTVREGGVE
jgi:signal transduction histidine kinase